MDNSIDIGPALIYDLLGYAIYNGLIEKTDINYTRNRLMELLAIDDPGDMLDITVRPERVPEYAAPILEKILDYCLMKGILTENTLTHRDLLDTRIMGVFISKPSEIEKSFRSIWKEKGIEAATDYFYGLCIKSNYIRMDRINRNIKWNSDSPFGSLEITINLTKPEKDPKEIAALKNAPQSGYPKCMLCVENTGYAGRVNFPARHTLRTLPLELGGEVWHFQYSPYVYYNEHCIVLSKRHVPMKLTRETFDRLLQFVDLFPHYFIGSNADLPIVGGSILNHDHFQGGRYVFPMEKAGAEYRLEYTNSPGIEAEVVKWPMSVLRLRSRSKTYLAGLAYDILCKWREYSDISSDIVACTKNCDGSMTPHNTITPIARRKKDGRYEMDLVLRNNRTSEEHPLGIFHPHADLHHIKKENIGLIEVMGLFILPGRLRNELEELVYFLTGDKADPDALSADNHPLNHHYAWLRQLIDRYGSSNTADRARAILKDEVGAKCLRVLQDAGVYKTDPQGRRAFNRFLAVCGFTVPSI
ncbi:MAG TPA: UDP-glucose--hexose-1-phosphate uridylyltransferase [Candidatus Atribacteria bacterium]|nr:UDP-glucose--hexose-1-phosphate uridylyltransferase [Candidatus Atribacteria bacterium]